MAIDEKTKDLFWSKVDIKKWNECWLWLASPGEEYAKFWLNGLWCRASRVVWEIVTGYAPPKELDVLHTCDNKRCVNYAHLYLGDASQNMADVMSRNPTSVNPEAALSEKDIILIRGLKVLVGYTRSGRAIYKSSTRDVAKMFNVSQSLIMSVWHSSTHWCKEGKYL
jgi:hypothetical protein